MKIELTKKQLNEIENARIEIYHLRERLNGVVDPAVLRPMKRMWDALDPIFKPLHDAEEALRADLQDTIELLYPDAPGVYSIDLMPKTKIHGIAPNMKVVFTREPFDGEYVSKSYTNPTYGDAFEAFCESIKVTGDDHHVFFEGVGIKKKKRGDDYVVVELFSGS